MRRHAEYARDFLAAFPVLGEEVLLILAHHVQWNGGGYPFGIRGVNIPLGARTIAISDTYQALVEERDYKDDWSAPKALSYMVNKAGSAYDLNLVRHMVRIVEPRS